jgi:beta-fructofuranosidase
MRLYYRPADGFVGDVIPFFNRDAYHLFYLKAPLPPAPRFLTPWAHIRSRDLMTWEELPVAIAPGGEGAPDVGGCWTGSVIATDDAFHMFYTGHAPNSPQRPQTVCHAQSFDLIHWEKDPGNPILTPSPRWYEHTDWRDPFVFRHPTDHCYWMLITARVKDAPTPRAGCIALAKSDDLQSWEVQPPLWTPHIVHAPECADLFPFGERWYMIFSTIETRYRVGLSPSGPWGTPPVESFDGPRLYAAKTLTDGDRRLLFGWVPTREGERDNGAWEWGGDLATPRQLEISEDGGLTVRCPDEISKQLGRPFIHPDEVAGFQARLGRWQASDEVVVGESQDGFGYAMFPEIGGDFAADVNITMDSAPTRAGLLIRAGEKLQRGYVLMLEPLYQRLTLRPWQSWGDAEPLVERPLRVVRGDPISFHIMVQGSIIEVLASGHCCLTCRLYDHTGGHLALFVENGLAEFSGFTAWRLSPE